jgi:acyl carrier protein
MNEKEFLIIFNSVFKSTFDTLNIDRKNFKEWDSMKHVELIIKLQKHFKFKFKVADIIEIINAKDFIKAFENAE